jgi:hypothetical protein
MNQHRFPPGVAAFERNRQHHAQLQRAIGAKPGDVPCNGCTICCQSDAIRLLPGDDPSQYQTVPHPLAPGQLMLDHQQDGSCIYLGTEGCTIHDRRPRMCRDMDCRAVALALNYTQARKNKGMPLAVWRRGKELLKGGK